RTKLQIVFYCCRHDGLQIWTEAMAKARKIKLSEVLENTTSRIESYPAILEMPFPQQKRFESGTVIAMQVCEDDIVDLRDGYPVSIEDPKKGLRRIHEKGPSGLDKETGVKEPCRKGITTPKNLNIHAHNIRFNFLARRKGGRDDPQQGCLWAQEQARCLFYRSAAKKVGQPSWLSLGFGPFPVKLERKIRLLEERGEVFPTSC